MRVERTRVSCRSIGSLIWLTEHWEFRLRPSLFLRFVISRCRKVRFLRKDLFSFFIWDFAISRDSSRICEMVSIGSALGSSEERMPSMVELRRSDIVLLYRIWFGKRHVEGALLTLE